MIDLEVGEEQEVVGKVQWVYRDKIKIDCDQHTAGTEKSHSSWMIDNPSPPLLLPTFPTVSAHTPPRKIKPHRG